MSTPSIAEHDSSGSAIRVDHRRGKVMRRLAGDDPEVNEEWITDKDRFAFTYATQGDRITTPLVRDPETRGARAGLLAGRTRDRRQGTGCCRRQGRRAARWPADRRGCLRVQQVRAHGAAHQRHRLPGPGLVRRGGGLLGLARRGDPD
ncbi:hypothetical protein [Aeromicrobium sp. UC242_57]|uniref:hypothetical protein n=1 Tax=Aeromicrobium sp. UC242_57 TaxID=3374624 RepID=UPI0037B3CBDE